MPLMEGSLQPLRLEVTIPTASEIPDGSIESVRLLLSLYGLTREEAAVDDEIAEGEWTLEGLVMSFDWQLPDSDGPDDGSYYGQVWIYVSGETKPLKSEVFGPIEILNGLVRQGP